MKSLTSEEEQDQEVTFPTISGTIYSKHVHAYIEGPMMDWTVNDGLYHRLLKWHLKYENILECELDILSKKKMQKGNCLES